MIHTDTDLEHLQSSQFYGRGVEHLFPGQSSVQGAPWPRGHRLKSVKDYDEERVRQVLSRPPQLQEVDSRNLHSTQPSITRAGVEYYAGSGYHRTGRTYEERADPTRGRSEGNRFPVIYRREPTTVGQEHQNLILSGHHRAAAALVKGEPLRAVVVEGPWGSTRHRPI